MKRIVALLIATVACASIGYAADVKIQVRLATSANGESVTSFPADTPKLFALFKTKGLQSGEKLRGVWIAEDVGDAAPKETKIDEKTLDAEGDTDDGVFSLSKPTKGWPIGEYRLEIYVGDDLVTTKKFTIGGGKDKKESDAAADGEKESDD
jgi:hypothetical protein